MVTLMMIISLLTVPNYSHFLKLIAYKPFSEVQGITIKDSLIFVLNEDGVIDVLDFSEPQNTHIVGRINLWRPINAIAVAGDYLFAMTSRDTLLIVDISDLNHPHVAGHFYYVSLGADKMAVTGDHLFLAKSNKFYILNISNALHPVLVSSFNPHGLVKDFRVSGNFIYSAENNNGMWIYDISNPSSPQAVGNFNDSSSYFISVEVADTIVFAGTSYRIYILNVTDPSSLTVLSTINMSSDLPVNLSYQSNMLFIATSSSHGVFYIYDVSDPTSPQLIAHNTDHNYGKFIEATVNALITSRYDSLFVFEDISNPVEVFRYSTTEGVAGNDFTLKGNYTYVAGGYKGVRILDISNPILTHEVGSYTEYNQRFQTIAANDSVIFAGSYGRIAILSVSNPESLQLLGHINTYGLQDMILKDSFLLTLQISRGVVVYNVSNPMNPDSVGALSIPDIYLKTFYLKDSLLFIANGNNLYIVNVSNPASPTMIDTFDTADFDPEVIAAQGNYVFTAQSRGSNSITVIDVSNPANPVVVGSVTLPYPHVTCLLPRGNLLYVLGESSPVYGTGYILNISNPASPEIVGYMTAGNKILARDTMIYVLHPTGLSVGVTHNIPVPTLISPPDSAMINTRTPTLVWSAPDATFWTYRVQIYNTNTHNYYIYHVDGDTTLTVPDNLYIGTNIWTVRIVGPFGAYGDSAEPFTFIIDTRAPGTPGLLHPIGGEWLNDTIVEFSWTASHLKGTPVSYIIQINGTVVDTVDTNYYLRNLPEGRYTWQVMAIDGAGNASDWSQPDSFGVDITPPQIDSVSFPGDTISFDSLSIYAHVSDSLSGVAGVTLFYSFNEAPFDSMAMVQSNGWMATIPLPSGVTNLSYFVRASDNAGNATYSDTFEVFVIGISESNPVKDVEIIGINPLTRELKILSPRETKVSLEIFDVAGRKCYTDNRRLRKGLNEIRFSRLPAGTYILRVRAGERKWVRKTVFLK